MRKMILVSAICLMSLSSFAQNQQKQINDNTIVNKYAVNPVLENIFARKSVRHYVVDANGNSKAISKDTLELILRAAMAAPSALNKQPWEFYVISDPAEMKSLANGLSYAKMIKTASAAIIVLGNPQVGKLWEQDCAAVTQNLLLAVESLGLGAVWTAAHPYQDRLDAIKATIDIPNNLIPFCVVPIGYPTGVDKPKDKWKPEKIHGMDFSSKSK